MDDFVVIFFDPGEFCPLVVVLGSGAVLFGEEPSGEGAVAVVGGDAEDDEACGAEAMEFEEEEGSWEAEGVGEIFGAGEDFCVVWEGDSEGGRGAFVFEELDECGLCCEAEEGGGLEEVGVSDGDEVGVAVEGDVVEIGDAFEFGGEEAEADGAEGEGFAGDEAGMDALDAVRKGLIEVKAEGEERAEWAEAELGEEVGEEGRVEGDAEGWGLVETVGEDAAVVVDGGVEGSAEGGGGEGFTDKMEDVVE